MIAKSHPAPGRLRSLDPFEIEPTGLSGIEMRWLAERWPLEPAADGPLGFLRTEAVGLQDTERRRAEQGLRRKGLLGERDEPVPVWELERTVAHGGFLRRSLEILQRPEARVRVGLLRPDSSPRQVQLYVADDQAALGARKGECFFVGPPIDSVALATAIFRNVESQPLPGAGPAIGLWPFLMDLVSALWPTGGPLPLRAVARPEALAALGGEGEGGAERGEALLDSLLSSGVATVQGDRIALASAYRPWLESMLSGYLIEVEYTPLGGEPSEAAGGSDRLLFAGPPGRRVVCGYLDRSLLDDGFLELPGAPVESEDGADQFLFLTQLSERALAVRLRELLHI